MITNYQHLIISIGVEILDSSAEHARNDRNGLIKKIIIILAALIVLEVAAIIVVRGGKEEAFYSGSCL